MALRPRHTPVSGRRKVPSPFVPFPMPRVIVHEGNLSDGHENGSARLAAACGTTDACDHLRLVVMPLRPTSMDILSPFISRRSWSATRNGEPFLLDWPLESTELNNNETSGTLDEHGVVHRLGLSCQLLIGRPSA
ncbi:hypothetical protein Ae201684P_005162 [Aphanomyces euteiches]|nr:hypothetical protein Ae201684P_005162 [Aphanomyces euteiches]